MTIEENDKRMGPVTGARDVMDIKDNNYFQKITALPTVLLLFALLLLFFSPASAAEPWQWQFTLGSDQTGVSLLMPSALYVDEERERYYVVDSGNNRLLSYDKTGKVLNAFDANKELESPIDMVRDSDGALLVVENGKNSLTRIDLKKKETKPFFLEDQGKTVYPDRLELAKGLFYVLDKASGSVLAYDSSMTVVNRFECAGCGRGFVDFVLHNGELWALEKSEESVYRFAGDGSLKAKIELEDEISFPVSIAVGPAGLLYILDRHEGAVAVFDQQGRFRYRFLEAGHERGQLYFPVELRFDPWNRLCVVEEGNGRVQVFAR